MEEHASVNRARPRAAKRLKSNSSYHLKEGAMEEDRIRFKKIFSNLPEKVREEDIIAVVDKKPYTWNAAFIEIENNTELGKKILKALKSLKII